MKWKTGTWYRRTRISKALSSPASVCRTKTRSVTVGGGLEKWTCCCMQHLSFLTDVHTLLCRSGFHVVRSSLPLWRIPLQWQRRLFLLQLSVEQMDHVGDRGETINAVCATVIGLVDCREKQRPFPTLVSILGHNNPPLAGSRPSITFHCVVSPSCVRCTAALNRLRMDLLGRRCWRTQRGNRETEPL